MTRQALGRAVRPSSALASPEPWYLVPGCYQAALLPPLPRALQNAGGREAMPVSLEIRAGPTTRASGFSSGSAFG